MRTIGLIGGMSWESTIPYYRIINEEVKKKMGGLHSAKIILYSVEFDEIEKCQSENRWEESGEILGKAAQALETAGADFILICTNTMHKVAPQIASMIKVPIIHIADATADELDKARIKRQFVNMWAVLRARRAFHSLRPLFAADREENLKKTSLPVIPERTKSSILVQFYLHGKKFFSRL